MAMDSSTCMNSTSSVKVESNSSSIDNQQQQKLQWTRLALLSSGGALAASLLALSTSAICPGSPSSLSSFGSLPALGINGSLIRRWFCPMVTSLDPWAFVWISYPTSTEEHSAVLFSKGIKDVQFILGWILVLGFMQKCVGYLLGRLYHSVVLSGGAGGGKKTSSSDSDSNESVEEELSKFKEQAFLFIYYTLSLSVGLYIYSQSKYYPMWEKSREFWTDYPLAQLDGWVKTYYLIQAAFWLQQLSTFLFFTAPHERRKDHYAMVAHHVITTLLVLSSYVFHLTRVGNAVLICMDTSDVFLCLAKSLKYLRFQKICDVIFGLFVVSWIVLRHGLYFFIWWSVAVEGSEALKDTKWDPWFTRDLSIPSEYERPGLYYSKGSWAFYSMCFAGLQGLLIMWFVMILRVLVKVIKGSGAEDVRED